MNSESAKSTAFRIGTNQKHPRLGTTGGGGGALPQ